MSSYSRIVTLDGRKGNSVKAWLRLIPGFRPEVIQRVSSYFGDIAGGVHSGRLTIATNAVQASGTITFSSFTTSDTITVDGVTLTGGTDFAIGASDTITAANAVAAINADTTSGLNSMVSATSAAAVITIKSRTPGYIGNMNTLAISAHGSVSGTNLANGTEDADIVVYNGI